MPQRVGYKEITQIKETINKNHLSQNELILRFLKDQTEMDKLHHKILLQIVTEKEKIK